MKPNKQQIQALYLAQQLEKQQEPVGGMLYFEAVTKCRLDYTPDSLKRLEKLFAQMRSKGITLEKILQHPKHKNFLLTLGVYIGNYVGHRIGEVPMWFGYEGFSTFTEDNSIPADFPFSLIAQYPYGICLPFGAIMEALSDDFSVTGYIEQTCDNILSKIQINLLSPASDICNEYLKRVRTGQLIDSNVAYSDVLKKIHFDYSYESLTKIDNVLAYIKKKENLNNKKSLFRKSSYDTFINDPARQAFIYLVGCYIGMTSAQLAKTTAKWFNHEEMQEMLNDPDYIFCIENNQVMMFHGNYLRLPLMAVTNYFFDLNLESSMGAVDFANNVLRDNASNLTSYSLPQYIEPIPNHQAIPDDWLTAAGLAGTLAAWNMVSTSDGGQSTPMSIDYQSESKNITLINHVDGDIDSLLEQLELPPSPDKAPFGFLSYDSYVNLPTGRTDGIMLKIKVYSKPTLTIDFVLPYRHAEHPFGFAIFPLVHYQPDDAPSDEVLPALVQAFYKAALAFNDPVLGTDYWSSYYVDEQDVFAPAAWLSKPIDTFDPEDSEIHILPLSNAP